MARILSELVEAVPQRNAFGCEGLSDALALCCGARSPPALSALPLQQAPAMQREEGCSSPQINSVERTLD